MDRVRLLDKLEHSSGQCESCSAKQRIKPKIMGSINFRKSQLRATRVELIILITLVPIFVPRLPSLNCQIQRAKISVGEYSSQKTSNVSLVQPKRSPPSLDKSRLVYREQEASHEPQAARIHSQRELPEQQTTRIGHQQSISLTEPNRSGHEWRRFESVLSKEVSNFAEVFKKSVGGLMGQANISSACYSSLNILINSLDQQHVWASQIIDSSAKHIPSGVFDGTFNELGNFDQCLAIRYPHNNSITNQLVSGQYCNVIIKPPVVNNGRMSAFQTVCSLKRIHHQAYPLIGGQANETLLFYLRHSQLFQYIRLHLGLCTPSSCSRLELQQMLNIYLHKYHLSGQVKSCQVLAPTENNYIGSHFDSLQVAIV